MAQCWLQLHWSQGVVGQQKRRRCCAQSRRSFHESSSRDASSILWVFSGVKDAQPSVWRLGAQAHKETFKGAIMEKAAEDIIFLPTKWFTKDETAIRRIPIFPQRIRCLVADCLATESGTEPPDTYEESLAQGISQLKAERTLLDAEYQSQKVKPATLSRLNMSWDQRTIQASQIAGPRIESSDEE